LQCCNNKSKDNLCAMRQEGGQKVGSWQAATFHWNKFLILNGGEGSSRIYRTTYIINLIDYSRPRYSVPSIDGRKCFFLVYQELDCLAGLFSFFSGKSIPNCIESATLPLNFGILLYIRICTYVRQIEQSWHYLSKWIRLSVLLKKV
jgi:hypothetical protein